MTVSPAVLPAEVHQSPTAELLLIYAVVFLVTIAASKVVSTLVVTALDRRASVRTAPGPRASGVARPSGPTFRIGVLPRSGEVLGVAYLGRKTDGIAEVLLAEALATGWLVFSGDVGHIGPLLPDASSSARDLHRSLAIGKVTRARANEAARRVACSLEPAIVSELESATLLRTWTLRRFGEATALVVALPTTVFGIARLLDGLRDAAGRAPSGGPQGGVLVLAIEIAVFVIAAIAAARVSPRSERAIEYLAWLHDATISLREDVATGSDQRLDDVLLATALGVDASSPVAHRAVLAGGVSGGGCGAAGCGSGGGCGS